MLINTRTGDAGFHLVDSIVCVGDLTRLPHDSIRALNAACSSSVMPRSRASR